MRLISKSEPCLLIRNQKCKSLPRTLDAGDEHKDVGKWGGGGVLRVVTRMFSVGEEGRAMILARLLCWPTPTLCLSSDSGSPWGKLSFFTFCVFIKCHECVHTVHFLYMLWLKVPFYKHGYKTLKNTCGFTRNENNILCWLIIQYITHHRYELTFIN